MTKRTEWQHRVADTKARLTTKLANVVFAMHTTPMIRLVKKLMKIDQTIEYTDPDLEHPP